MADKDKLSRRQTLTGMTAVGASTILGPRACADEPSAAPPAQQTRRAIREKVDRTPFVDTHEHLIEEHERLKGASHRRVVCDDWAMLLSHYLNSDLIVAGMPRDVHDRFFSAKTDPAAKWNLLEPYWPAVKNTGHGQAVRIAIQQLYEVDDLSGGTARRVQQGYEETRRPGFYRHILCDRANIESCQVNSLTGPFSKSPMPSLLMQDISIVGMFAGPDIAGYARPAGIEVESLADWHRVIDWWFDRYGRYAVAVKSQNAYSRDIDYDKVPAPTAEPIFRKRLENKPLSPAERKQLEDHLFWYAVDKATEHDLPVKLHTGYYAGQNRMPLERLIHNAASAARLCRTSPQTTFVFMHICYPYYEEILSVAKQYTNACIDMCWSWIINPVAAKDFLKKYLVTAPANKILTFGGDYIPVEPVLGHAAIARRGITQALTELVEEGWLTMPDALDLIEPIMRANAQTIFNLETRTKALKNAPWA